MSEYLRYVLYELKNSLVLVLLAGVLAVFVLVTAYFIHKYKFKGEKAFPWARIFLWLVFLGYLLIVIYATMLRWSGFFHREWNFHLFRAWREAWNNFSVKNWANVLLNVAMFMPMGFLLPLLGKRLRKWYATIPVGFAASLAIELFQLAAGRGICDVDDLFCNVLGAVIGYFLIMTVLSLFREKGKRAKHTLIYGSLSLVCCMGVCSIFLAYQLQEYGNLPDAAAFISNTQGTAWQLDCQLPEVGTEAPVYRTQTRSKEACDAFAEDFRKRIGIEYTTISYYQEAAYYMDQSGDENGSHFLFVSYLDPSYKYSCSRGDNPVWQDADRLAVEAALSHLPVWIPDYAEFTVEGDGWHSFTADRHIDGSVMVDGTLRCRYANDGTVRKLEYNLLSYTYYDTVRICSPQSAYDKMCSGEFGDGGYFESIRPELVRVISCTLGYAIDTKGIYQPVYYFEVMSPDGSYAYRIMIPGMI